MFLNDVNDLTHTVVVGILAYIAIIFLLRISGKRTLSKWNSFDFVVTVAFGSLLASTILSNQTSLIRGILGFGLLIFLQYIITFLSVHSSIVQKLVKGDPTLLLYKGEFQNPALRKERVSQGEVLAAIRAQGIASVENVEAVVLETDGSFSVVKEISGESDSAFQDVEGYRLHLKQ